MENFLEDIRNERADIDLKIKRLFDFFGSEVFTKLSEVKKMMFEKQFEAMIKYRETLDVNIELNMNQS